MKQYPSTEPHGAAPVRFRRLSCSLQLSCLTDCNANSRTAPRALCPVFSLKPDINWAWRDHWPAK
jgi:hypothetical protein